MTAIDYRVDLGVRRANLPFVCFAAFVVTFVATRDITRMIRAGRGPFHDDVSSSGVHIHHAVPGIILLITGAFWVSDFVAGKRSEPDPVSR
jgi:hypothetical protein